MILNFNTKLFPFKEIILNVIFNMNNKAKNKYYALDKIHNYNNLDDINIIYKKIYNLFRQKIFLSIYQDFCNKLIKSHFSKNTIYQKIPSVRIQLPYQKSVNFHNDNFYGHGENIKNIWLPLTTVSKSNSLYYLNKKKSDSLIKQIIKDKMTIDEINKASLIKSQSLEMEYGQYFLFDSKIIHGTKINRSGRSRISIDFRFSEDGEIGLKDYSFYSNKKKNNKKIKVRKCVCYFNRSLHSNKLPSQKYQQILCLEYCSDNFLNPIILETELNGFNYFPVLKNLIQKSIVQKYRDIVIYSRNNLPINSNQKKTVLVLLKKYKINLHFVIENQVRNYIYENKL